MQITFLCYLFHEFKVLKFCPCSSIIHWIYMRVQGDRRATPNVGSSADKGQTGPAPHQFRPASWTGQCDLSTGSLITYTHPHPHPYIYIPSHIVTHTHTRTHTHPSTHQQTSPHTHTHRPTHFYIHIHPNTHTRIPSCACCSVETQ